MADDSLQTEVAARIDPICQEFEAAWQRIELPSIDDFLERADVADREALRIELQHLDAEYRQRPVSDGKDCSLPRTMSLDGRFRSDVQDTFAAFFRRGQQGAYSDCRDRNDLWFAR